jgi:hypothetical protein
MSDKEFIEESAKTFGRAAEQWYKKEVNYDRRNKK